MSQQRKLSRHNSRQSSIGETTSVGSTKSGKSNASSDYYPSNATPYQSTNNNITSRKKSNGLAKNGSQDSGDSVSNGCTSQPSATSILNVAEMLLHGVADHEILDIWLRSIDCEEFIAKFIDSGYDMPTLSRITPQDLTAIGVREPNKRLKILTEIKKLNLQDGIPNFMPADLHHLLTSLRLESHYYKSLCDQHIDTIEKLCQLTWEDFEDLGITKLGHQKRFQLAIERLKEMIDDATFNPLKPVSEPIYDTNPSQILLVSSTENHSMNCPIINKQSSTSELSSTGSGSMHSVYSSASTQYQTNYAPLSSQQQQTQQHLPPSHQQSISQHADSQSLGGQLSSTNHNGHINGINQSQQLQHQHQPLNQQQQQQQHFNMMKQGPHFCQPSSQPSIYQQPSAVGHPGQPVYKFGIAPQPPMQFESNFNGMNMMTTSQFGVNGSNVVNTNGHMNVIDPQHMNRQSMGQLPFSALARLPKQQQQILQQSSIYATLRRQPQPSKIKQPPPPVPIRTNSLKSNTLTDHKQHQIIQQHQTQSHYQEQHQNQISHFPNYMGPNFGLSHQLTPQTMSLGPSGGIIPLAAINSTPNCNATTGQDDNFPPPPSPLSSTEHEDPDTVAANMIQRLNFADVNHGIMPFKVGI